MTEKFISQTLVAIMTKFCEEHGISGSNKILFRRVTYKYLNPEKIWVNSDNHLIWDNEIRNQRDDTEKA
jgi:hypothetical protein